VFIFVFKQQKMSLHGICQPVAATGKKSLDRHFKIQNGKFFSKNSETIPVFSHFNS
jgi:hypothetical protein